MADNLPPTDKYFIRFIEHSKLLDMEGFPSWKSLTKYMGKSIFGEKDAPKSYQYSIELVDLPDHLGKKNHFFDSWEKLQEWMKSRDLEAMKSFENDKEEKNE